MTTTTNTSNTRQGEKGNVLFLILIAVALFAALSYAVTQSTRSGSGDAAGETALINSAQLAQYPAGVRTAVVRMVIGGVGVEQLRFDTPSDFTDLETAVPALDGLAVFHPNGGGAVYQRAPNEIMADGQQGEWIFSSDYEIAQIGQSVAASPNGNDIIAFVNGVSSGICRRINEELGINGTDADGDGALVSAGFTVPPVYATHSMTEFNPANSGIGNEVSTIDGAFTGQPFGCVDTDDGDANSDLVYYHVLVER